MSDASPLAHLVYGLFDRYDGFVFLDSRTAGAVVAEIAALTRATTLGELRALYPTLLQVDGPVHPDYEEWTEQPDAAAIDLTVHESWPPFPPYFQVDLPAEVVEELEAAAAVDWYAPMMDGEFFVIRVAHEPDMLAVLARHDIPASRDDLVVAGLGE